MRRIHYAVPFTTGWRRDTIIHRFIVSYFVYRRSALDPLFHPYYINYGANKVEMYVRLRAMQCVPSLKR